jgi:hypothetical protein
MSGRCSMIARAGVYSRRYDLVCVCVCVWVGGRPSWGVVFSIQTNGGGPALSACPIDAITGLPNYNAQCLTTRMYLTQQLIIGTRITFRVCVCCRTLTLFGLEWHLHQHSYELICSTDSQCTIPVASNGVPRRLSWHRICCQCLFRHLAVVWQHFVNCSFM